ncbi:MAG TPA: hypothetical protein VHJ78_14070 [Actinomycetota bacterium]|nr:hypothetical protein [Actinomycetota bacterium]
MGEFQKKKAQEDLLSALRNMGLGLSPDLRPAAGRSGPMGPAETAPAAYGELAPLAPGYLPPAPAEATPTLPLGAEDAGSDEPA